MKKVEGGRSQGYTIVETMIFLAVTAAMFVSAMAFINGRQASTEFTTAVRDFESNMNDVASDVSTGYYASAQADANRLRCQVGAGAAPQITAVSGAAPSGAERGANKGCIFIGKAIQFAPQGSSDQEYSLISLVGLQYKGGFVANGEVTSLAESKVRPIAKISGSDPTPNEIDTRRLNGGITIGCVLYSGSTINPGNSPCTSVPAGATRTDLLAFVSTFSAGNYQGGSNTNQVDMYASTQAGVAPQGNTSFNAASRLSALPSNNTLPAGGVMVCLQSNGSNQRAIIRLGGQSSRFNVSSVVEDGKCA